MLVTGRELANIGWLCTAKSKNLLFAGSVSKKRQAKLTLFWSKGNETPRPRWFFVGVSRFEGEACFAFKPKPVRQKRFFTF
ncbi:MAG: hypothetical protein LBU11_00515 [Zoogloeaceae bacterium]|jgi:hypothetical protein|nr:hypothetical protein [Zoogloeaceae bacterium]